MSPCNKKLFVALLVSASTGLMAQEADVSSPKGPALSDAIRKNVTLEDYIASQRLALSVEVAKANAAGMVLQPPPKPAPVPKVKPEAQVAPISEPTLIGAMSGPTGRFVADVMFEGRSLLVRPGERVGNSPWILIRGAVVGPNIETTFIRPESYAHVVDEKTKKTEQRVRQVQRTFTIPVNKG